MIIKNTVTSIDKGNHRESIYNDVIVSIYNDVIVSLILSQGWPLLDTKITMY